jgi:hypothetical protein
MDVDLSKYINLRFLGQNFFQEFFYFYFHIIKYHQYLEYLHYPNLLKNIIKKINKEK